LLGSVGEANKLFEDLAQYAGKVPFQLDEIMESATTLGGIMDGGRKQIMSWMPLIGDLAAATGLGIRETTEQVQRMLSAGAASADRFRERGVLAMLGFQAGVSYSAKETEERLEKAWESSASKFRGATDEMAKTWTGSVSMLGDAWFQFKRKVMEAGVIEYLKAGIDKATESMGGMKEAAPKVARFVITSIDFIARATARIVDGYKVAKIAALSFGKAAVQARVFVEDLTSPGTWDDFKSGVRSLIAGMESEVKSIQDQARKGYFAAVKKATDAERAVLILEKDIAAARKDTYAIEDVNVFLEKMRTQLELQEKSRDLQKKQAGAIKKTTAAVHEFSDAIRGAFEPEEIVDYAAHTMEVRTHFQGWSEDIEKFGEALDDTKKKTKENKEEIVDYGKKLKTGVADVLSSSILRAIDDAIEGTFNWQRAVRGLAKDMAMMAARMALQVGMKAAFGLAKGGVVPGGLEVPSAAQGRIAMGPQLMQVGDNREKAEAVLPLQRDAKGDLGVVAAGGGGGATIIVQAMDSADVLRSLQQGGVLRTAIQGLVAEGGSEGLGL
jgi:hypothetical protein